MQILRYYLLRTYYCTILQNRRRDVKISLLSKSSVKDLKNFENAIAKLSKFSNSQYIIVTRDTITSCMKFTKYRTKYAYCSTKN